MCRVTMGELNRPVQSVGPCERLNVSMSSILSVGHVASYPNIYPCTY